jgi:hypothetical protein
VIQYGSAQSSAAGRAAGIARMGGSH